MLCYVMATQCKFPSYLSRRTAPARRDASRLALFFPRKCHGDQRRRPHDWIRATPRRGRRRACRQARNPGRPPPEAQTVAVLVKRRPLRQRQPGRTRRGAAWHSSHECPSWPCACKRTTNACSTCQASFEAAVQQQRRSERDLRLEVHWMFAAHVNDFGGGGFGRSQGTRAYGCSGSWVGIGRFLQA